jgi:tRNA(Ile)-lysidine synthase
VKYVLAISGGVDSVVLLDMIAHGKLLLQKSRVQKKDLLVAHFNHGIRKCSADDAKLVEKLANNYQIECVVGHGNLKKDASEQLAREKRYKFLREICRDDSYRIVTGHHQDDLLETIVINLIRGTGWRGLAPFWSNDILRPLLDMDNTEIVNYAIEQNLDWAEDETNYSIKYFRNRVRDLVVRIPIAQRKQLIELSQKQIKLRIEIEKILEPIASENSSYKVESILKLPTNLAIEVLRKVVDEKLTTPQLRRLLGNLRGAKSGDIFQPGGKVQVGIYCGHFVISKLPS